MAEAKFCLNVSGAFNGDELKHMIGIESESDDSESEDHMP